MTLHKINYMPHTKF